MNYLSYQKKRMKQYEKEEYIEQLNASMFYEEKFRLAWLATKLKTYSFLSSAEKIDVDTIKNYSEQCIQFALSHYKGLIRGLQNGIVSFNVLASEEITPEAIKFVTSRPKKHFAAFEMPVIVDLKNETLYFYSKTPMWGMIYYRHFRNYITTHFGF